VRPLSRRSLLLGGAAIAAGAAGGVWTRGPAAAPTGGSLGAAEQLRKCISLGPVATPDGDDQDYRAHDNAGFVASTGTRWIKLWARWDQIQPLSPALLPWSRLDDPSANPGHAYLAALDAQVALARAQDPPVSVILQSWLFPQWSNGTAGLVDGSAEDLAFEPHDRVSREAFEAGDPELSRKRLFFRVPAVEQLGVDGHWGRWTRFLYERYAAYGDGVVLEVVNEPNLQWWPQQGPSTTGDPFEPGGLSVPVAAATMLRTAQEIGAEHGHPIRLAGPSTWDGPKSDPIGPIASRGFTDYERFTQGVLVALGANGFEAPPSFVWTQHNYLDTLLDLGADTGARNRAAATRASLVGRWSGWPQRDGATDAPGVWLTEGGVDLREDRVAGDLQTQRRLLERNWDRMASDTGDGSGIAMLTNYLGYSEDHYDSGLRDPLADGGAPRPVAEAWRRF
jgi:hypothetical protein